MPRTRTTPTPTKTVYFDTIDALVLQVGYDNNMQLSAVNTKFLYAISNRDAVGAVVENKVEEIPWLDLPAPVKTAFKDLFAKALLDAADKGLIGAGADSNDLP